jgi:hypothetical protein
MQIFSRKQNLILFSFLLLLAGELIGYFFDTRIRSLNILFAIAALLFTKYKIQHLRLIVLLFAILIFYTAMAFNAEYLFEKFNHYPQVLIYVLYFLTLFKYIPPEKIFVLVRNNYTLLFSILIFISFLLWYSGLLYTDFLLVILLLFFSLTYHQDGKTNAKLLLLTLFSLFIFDRSSPLIIIFLFFVFTLLKFIRSKILFILNKIVILLCLFYPFIILPLINNAEFFTYIRDYIDYNTFYRLESLRNGLSLLNQDVSNYFFGVGFTEAYRSTSADLSILADHTDFYNVSVIPNHNSYFDLVLRFGFIGAFPLIFLQYKLFLVNYKTHNFRPIIALLNTIFMLEISINPWLEDQNQILISSFLLAVLIDYYYDLQKNKIQNLYPRA